MTFIRVPREKIPDTLPLYRALAEKNDPSVLESKDLDDFVSFFKLPTDQFSPAESVVSACWVLANRTFSPALPSGSLDAYDLFRFSQHSIELVQSLSGKPNLLERSDSKKLAAYFGTEASSLVEAVQKQHELLRQKVRPVAITSAKFGDDPVFVQRVAEAEAIVPKAFLEFNQRFGLSVAFPKPPRGVVRVEDLMPPVLESPDKEAKRKLQPLAQFFASGPLNNILFASELLMKGGLKSLKHEVNHLWLFGALKDDHVRFVAVPRWFREGLAVIASDHQLEDKKMNSLPFKAPQVSAVLWNSEPDSMAVENPREYYAAGLAVQILIDRHGPNVIGRIIGHLNRGKSFAEALRMLIPNFRSEAIFYQDVQRETLKRMQAAADAQTQMDYLETISEVLPNAKVGYESPDPGLTVFGEAYEIIGKAKTRGDARFILNRWRDAFQQFLLRHPRGPYATAVHFLLGVTLIRLKRNTEALVEFNEVLKNSGKTWTFSDDALYYSVFLSLPRSRGSAAKIKEMAKLLTSPKVRKWATADVRRFKKLKR